MNLKEGKPLYSPIHHPLNKPLLHVGTIIISVVLRPTPMQSVFECWLRCEMRLLQDSVVMAMCVCWSDG
jgi:hypothetical protein